jgi:hypothetical protein
MLQPIPLGRLRSLEDISTQWSFIDVRVDLLRLLTMLVGCGLFLSGSVCLLLSCKPRLLRLPASRVRLFAMLASFDTLLVELPRTLAPRDERHSGQNDDHCNDNQNDRGGAHTVSPSWVVGPKVWTLREP